MKYCCERCFNHNYLVEFIREHDKGVEGSCNYCLENNVICIPPKELTDLFLPLINLYSPVSDILTSEVPAQESCIWDKLQSDWSVFGENTDRQGLLIDILSNCEDANIIQMFDSPVVNQTNSLSTKEEIKDHVVIWQTFTEEIKNKNRFFPTGGIDLDGLKKLFEFLQNTKKSTDIFFRARNSFGKEKFEPQDMGKPPAENTLNGRANPAGIAYLYLASDINTAISEIRPYKNDLVTVGYFVPKQEIYLIDLRDVSPFQFHTDEDFEKSIMMIDYLNTLGSDLSKPINPKTVDLEYLPTQYLCEFIKKLGWNGVIYRSSLSQGYNLTIFDDSKLICNQTVLYKMANTKYAYDEVT